MFHVREEIASGVPDEVSFCRVGPPPVNHLLIGRVKRESPCLLWLVISLAKDRCDNIGQGGMGFRCASLVPRFLHPRFQHFSEFFQGRREFRERGQLLDISF